MSEAPRVGMGARLFAGLQYVLPHHALSRIIHWLTRREGGALTRSAIRLFVRVMRVDLRDAQTPDPGAFLTFNAFFTRSLVADARPLAPSRCSLISPVDGTVSQAGDVQNGTLLQAKGRTYTLDALLGGPGMSAPFVGGRFATLYLAPYNYHRIHMPRAGRLLSMMLIPGRLFSVNAATASTVPDLFARNERVVCQFDSDEGPFAMVLVGAMFVGSIETVWAGEVTPGGGRQPRRWDYGPGAEAKGGGVTLARGEEMGRFNMGSTVILVDGQRGWRSDLRPGLPIRMGEALCPESG